MPDFTNQSFYQCPTADYWQAEVTSSDSSKPPYVVKWSQWGHKTPGMQYDFSCTCKGYQTRGNCRHIEAVKDQHCGWLQFVSGEEPVEKDGIKCCPLCGAGPVEARNWAI